LLRNEEFNDDTRDAGEIGAGHTVAAIYEIVPAGVPVDAPEVDPLKYQTSPRSTNSASAELMTVKVRYKEPDGDTSRLLTHAVPNTASAMSPAIGFASAVAEVGMLLRGTKHAGAASFPAAIARARQFRGSDPDGYRAEFVRLAELAASLTRMNTSSRR